tara:strand:- start:836 stop:1975 length:1140 start_codon:yes stop_codon:yes gene_type:complete
MKKSICFFCTAPITFQCFLKEHAIGLLNTYNVTLISNFENYEIRNIPSSIKVHSVPFKRKISLINDLYTLTKLYYLINKKKFDLTLSISPKAGLLVSIASFMSFTPVRIHWFTGQVWANKTGPYKKFLMFLDWLIANLSTNLLVDSLTQREFLYKKKIIKKINADVLAYGSVSGVDTKRFVASKKIRSQVREKLSINEETKLLVFAGRLNKDKGIFDLIEAFTIIKRKGFPVKLLLIGPDEEKIIKKISDTENFLNSEIIYLGPKYNIEYWLNGCDIFCLPSYREGFGNILIEASALKLPIVASKIYGIEDAVLDKVTGLLFNAGNVNELIKAIILLHKNDKLCKKLGDSGFERVNKKFTKTILNKAFFEYINSRFDQI